MVPRRSRARWLRVAARTRPPARRKRGRPPSPRFPSCSFTFAGSLPCLARSLRGLRLTRAERADRDRKSSPRDFRSTRPRTTRQLRPNSAVALRLTAARRYRNESLRLRATAFDCSDGYVARSPFDSAAIPLHRAAARLLRSRHAGAPETRPARRSYSNLNLDSPSRFYLRCPLVE
jgi:hypothetical protein